MVVMLIVGVAAGYGTGMLTTSTKEVTPSEMAKQLAILQNQVKDKEKQIIQLQNQLKNKDAQISSLQQKIKDLQSQIEALTVTKPTPTESPEITGTVTVAPELEGKIEVRGYKFIYNNERPSDIGIEMKNISNEPLKIYIEVTYKDVNENVLDVEESGIVKILPKEIHTIWVSVFHSDELKFFEAKIIPVK